MVNGGTARLAGSSAHGPTGRFRADWRPLTKIAAMQRLGTVPDSGRVTIDLSANRLGVVPDQAVLVSVDLPGSSAGRGIGMARMASILPRSRSGRRTTMSKRRSPSNSFPALFPPTAISTMVWTSPTLRP